MSRTIRDQLLRSHVFGGAGAVVVATASALLLPLWAALLAVAIVIGILTFVAARTSGRLTSGVAALPLLVRRGVERAPGRRDPVEAPTDVYRVAREVGTYAREIADRAEGAVADVTLREEILSSLSEGVLLVEADGALAYANAAAERLLGGSKSLPPHVMEEGSHEISVHHPAARDLRVVTTMVGGNRKLTVVQDVTGIRRIEAIRRDFVADASHELKTPVASILATAETLEVAAREDPGRIASFTGALVAESRRLAHLIGDLLDLARFEQSPSPVAARVALGAVLRRSAQAVETTAGLGAGEVSVQAAEIDVAGSDEDLELAFRNLVENAVRHGAPPVVVRATTRGRHAVVTVADSGPGIPAKDLPRLFERFYRVDKARSRETGGTGLGLAIVRHIVERHGGNVRAESILGEGARFIVTLPLGPAAGASEFR